MAADPDTLESAEKTVLETYVRKVSKLVYLTINGEIIVTTDNHPFYVQGRGFIEAGNLLVGDKLVSANGENLLIEDYQIELIEEPVSVYNFQIEDFHTYFVGECGAWVHNACTKEQVRENYKNGEKAEIEQYNKELIDQLETERQISVRAYDENGNLSCKRTKLDLLNDNGINEVKATKTAPLTQNQKELFPQLEKYGGEVVGKGKGKYTGGTALSPQTISVTRDGVTRTFSEDLKLFGGKKNVCD